MRATPTLAILAVSIAGCVDVGGQAGGPVASPSAGPRIADVQVRPNRLTVRMSDGARCVAERPEGVQSGWSGTTADCGYALPFTVTFARGGDAGRFSVEEGFGSVTETGVPGPRAEVFITDVDGVRRLFMRPLPERVFADAAS